MPTPKTKGLSVNDLEKPEFWKKLNPYLHISDNPFTENPQQYPIEPGKMSQHVRQMVKEGYLQTDPIIPRDACSALVPAVQNIFRLGLPAPFAFVYDEFWQLLDRLSNILTPLLGADYKFIPDFWVWHIPKHDHAGGWGPHRDFQHGRHALRQDGRPTLVTLWIPLTDVTPLNACMYVLPLHHDPNYPDNISNQTVAHNQLQSIRALPAEAGSILGWNSYVIHWGGKSSEWARQPRISLGIYFQSGDIEPFDEFAMNIPCPVPFEFRLGAIGRGILMYNNHFLSENLSFSKPLLGLCDKYASKLALDNNQPRS